MDLERIRIKDGKRYIDPKDSWNIYWAEQIGERLRLHLKDAGGRTCGYTLEIEDVIWNLCGKIYLLRNKQEIFDFYSAVQSMLECRAIDEALK